MNHLNRVYNLDLFDLLIRVFFVTTILLAHLCMRPGFVWARQGAMWMALFMLGSWGLQCMRRGRVRFRSSPLWIVMPAAGFMFGLYLLPLSPEVLRLLSPATDALYAHASPCYPMHGVTKTLSVDSGATMQALKQGLMFASILFVVINAVRTRSQTVFLIVVLTIVGLTQVFYGVTDQILTPSLRERAGNVQDLHCLTGTFRSRQYFSGLLVMIVPLLLGLVIALTPRLTRSAPVSRGLLVFSPFRFSYPQILLCMGLVVLMGGICFSLSRAGICCLIASGVGFAVVFAVVIRLRMKTILLLLTLLVILGIALGVGMQMMLDRVETVDADVSLSWQERIGLWQNSLALFGEFPLLGTGPGTYGSAMAILESPESGRSVYPTPRNDCIKILCETGLLGLLAVTAAGYLILHSLIRKTLLQKETFHRCIATGAMVGTCVMIVYCFYAGSLVDVPANSVVFAVILGLWHVAAEGGDLREEQT